MDADIPFVPLANQTFSQTCACRCGASQLLVTARPRVRYLCHCTICQAVYRKPYAVITALRAEDVTLTEAIKSNSRNIASLQQLVAASVPRVAALWWVS